MKIGECFRTGIGTCDYSGLFEISITQESDFSYDGGYSFENVENTIMLDKDEAKDLITELQKFINID